MNGFSLSDMRNASPWGLYRIKDTIDLSPTYQRESGIWDDEKRQLLIDTIINRFDVPKIYMHKFNKPIEQDGQLIEYAVIDGKQRIETIFKFIEGKFALASGFEYYHGDEVSIANYKYADLAREYPAVKNDFDATPLDVVIIQTEDTELIEELFSRLNEAVPLNAAEKRNAMGGPLPGAVRELCALPFWTNKIPFTNRRYRHFDLAAKMLYIESRKTVPDTKKAYLDRFFQDHPPGSGPQVNDYLNSAKIIVEKMHHIFVDNDVLLRSVGMIVVYFHLIKRAMERDILQIINRPTLLEFEHRRRENKRLAEEDIGSSHYNLLEFDRFAQSPNDAIATRFRLFVMDDLLFSGALGFELAEAGSGS